MKVTKLSVATQDIIKNLFRTKPIRKVIMQKGTSWPSVLYLLTSGRPSDMIIKLKSTTR